MKRCYSCFHQFGDEFNICPYCGQKYSPQPKEPIYLTPGTILAQRYVIGQAVGAGGFGIVYKAWDLKLETIVAIKEFFVTHIMTRAAGLNNAIVSKKSQTEYEYRKKRFLAEARNMAKFGSHRSIPNVFEFFEANNTAYIVMEFLNGIALNNFLTKVGGRVDVDFAIAVANEVGNALRSLHGEKIIHRDVAPDNIFICTGKNVKIKLMDLGAAKLQDSTDDVIDIVLKPGFSPPEQYDNTKNIGPWSDIYALGATMYTMLTGVKPDESTNRKIADDLPNVNELNPAVSENLNNTIMKAMAIDKHMRFKSIDEFLLALNGEKKIVPLATERKKRKLKRFSGIVAACVILAIISTVVFKSYSNSKAREYLDEAVVTIWVMDKGENDSSGQKSALKMLCEDNFNKQAGNEKVTVIFVEMPEDKYLEKLTEAFQGGGENAPTLFESTVIEDSYVSSIAESPTEVIDSSEFKECEVLKKNYNKCYPSKSKIPLEINVPLGFVLGDSKSENQIELSNGFDEFATYNFFVDQDMSEYMKAPYSYTETTLDALRAKDGVTNTVFLSSSEKWYEINKLNFDESDHLDTRCFYTDQDTVNCEFTYEWSISKTASPEQKKAAEKLLRYMMKPDYLSKICSKNVTVNPEALGQSFANIKENYSKFIFEEK